MRPKWWALLGHDNESPSAKLDLDLKTRLTSIGPSDPTKQPRASTQGPEVSTCPLFTDIKIATNKVMIDKNAVVGAFNESLRALLRTGTSSGRSLVVRKQCRWLREKISKRPTLHALDQ